MRAHLSNSAYGVLDYVAQPAGMLIAAPILLHHLGLAPYGLWLIASAAVSAGSIVSSGFGDAVIQRVASLRASNDLAGIRRVIANVLAINLVLGGSLAVLLWLLIPLVVTRITHADPTLRTSCVWSLRIGAILIVIKSVESVFISAQRAYERYAPAVRIGIATRIITIALSIFLALHSFGVAAMMLGTAVLTILGAIAQWAALRRHLGRGLFRPAFDRETSRQLGYVGSLTWLQAVSGVIFGQADRLILGAVLGASAVAYYGICVQISQPIHGLTAAGLHFLFPHLAANVKTGKPSSLRRSILTASTVNLSAAVFFTSIVIFFGPRVLARWVGQSFASYSAHILPLIAVSFGLLALNVTAHYTLMALGHFRLVTVANLVGGLLMLLVMTVLLPRWGIQSTALARLCYGVATLSLYLPLLRLLRSSSVASLSLAPIPMEQA